MSESKSNSNEEKIQKNIAIESDKLILNWHYKDVDKELSYDIKKCIGCSLCKIVCPVDAIELGPIADIAKGSLDESNPKLLIDHEKCCYCMLCAVVCPNDAFHENIKPEGEIDLDEYPSIQKFYEIDMEKCIEDDYNEICKLCLKSRERHHIKDYFIIQKECPNQCFKINSPIEGEVKLKKHMLWKCTPENCKACINICPVDSFFIPETAEEVKKYGKIACNEDECFYCGACENSCPDDLIFVQRNEINLKDPEILGNFPWVKAWIKYITEIIERRLIEEKKPVKIPEVEKEIERLKEEIEETVPQLSQKEKEELNRLNQKIKEFFRLKRIRYWIKDGKSEKVRDELKKLLSKD